MDRLQCLEQGPASTLLLRSWSHGPVSSGMPSATGIPRGGAMALHPKRWPFLWRGHVLIEALQVVTQGSSPRAVDPNVKVLPSAQGRDLSNY